MTLKDLKKMAIFVKTLYSGKLFLIFLLILIRLALGLKQIPQENESNMSIFSDFLKKLLINNQIFRLLVNGFLTRFLSKSRIIRACCCHFFHGICLKPHANLTSINGNIKKSLNLDRGFFNGIRHCCCFEVT